MIEAFNIMQDRLTRMRLAGDPPDMHITPHIGNIGWLDFHRAAEAIEAGKSRDRKGAGADRRHHCCVRLTRFTLIGAYGPAYCEGGRREQFVWHDSCVVVQFDRHAIFAVGLVVGVTLVGVTVGDIRGAPGTKQLLWQLAEVALQVIMQLVTADEMLDDDDGGADVDGTLGVGA